jgi:RNA methyltransferase, TrmH family
MLITSRSHPAVKRFRALRSRGAEEGLCVLEGVKLIEEALSAGLEILEGAASPRALRAARGEALVARLQGAGTAVRMVSEEVLASLSDVEQDQGVAAVARRRLFPEAALFRGTPLVLVAVGIQNPGNVGALLRTSEAAGATGAYLAGCADPWSWKALRGSMGSTFRLPHLRTPSAGTALEALHARQVKVYATASRSGIPYDGADLRGPTALMIGNEGAGLDPAVLEATGARLVIPMAGQAESLNVGVAAGILLFEAARQRRIA